MGKTKKPAMLLCHSCERRNLLIMGNELDPGKGQG
jgi:hypothetical protein